MSIQFGAYDGTVTGSLQAVLPTYDSVFTPLAIAALRAVLPPPTATFQGEVATTAPQYLGLSAVLPTFSVSLKGTYTALGSLDAVLPQVQTDFYPGPRLRAQLPAPTARLSAARQAAITPTMTLTWTVGAEYQGPQVNEEVVLEEAATSQWVIVLQSIAQMEDIPTVIANLQATLSSSVVAQDMFTLVFQRALEDELVVEDDLLATARAIYILAEQLMLADDAVGTYSALVLVASALVLAEEPRIGLDGRLTDDFEITEELATTIGYLVQVIEEIIAEDDLEPSLALFGLVADTFALDASPAALVAAIAEILDTVQMGVRVVTPNGDVFVGYTVNTRTAAVSEYDNFPFNSMAVVGGIPFGATADGIYRMEGDDDDGAPIHASIYTGLTDFGNSFLKQLPAAWIGLTSTGDMVLKVITTDGGKRKENWYRMAARPGGTPVDSRFSPAKGLLGRYYGFKLENLDGADFTLDSLKLWPLITKRRYSGR